MYVCVEIYIYIYIYITHIITHVYIHTLVWSSTASYHFISTHSVRSVRVCRGNAPHRSIHAIKQQHNVRETSYNMTLTTDNIFSFPLFFLWTALDSLYNESMGTSGRNYWTTWVHAKETEEGEHGTRREPLITLHVLCLCDTGDCEKTLLRIRRTLGAIAWKTPNQGLEWLQFPLLGCMARIT